MNVQFPKKLHLQRQNAIDPGYFVVSDSPGEGKKKTSDEKKLQAEGKGFLGLRSKELASCASLVKALPSMVGSPDAITLLRDALVEERSRGHESKLNSFKHFYVVGSGDASLTQTAVLLFSPSQGSGTSNRLTNDVRLHRITCRIRIVRNSTAPGTTQYTVPTISLVIGRTKVPTTPGTVATIHGTGANPPTSSTAIYDGLGTFNVPSLMIRNPNTADLYHVYHNEHVIMNDENFQYTTAATAYGISSPKSRLFEKQIDLHGLENCFVSSGNTDTLINQLWFVFRSDMSYTNQGFTDTVQYTFDTEFRDVQD